MKILGRKGERKEMRNLGKDNKRKRANKTPS
jgi:hypothetical protein